MRQRRGFFGRFISRVPIPIHLGRLERIILLHLPRIMVLLTVLGLLVVMGSRSRCREVLAQLLWESLSYLLLVTLRVVIPFGQTISYLCRTEDTVLRSQKSALHAWGIRIQVDYWDL